MDYLKQVDVSPLPDETLKSVAQNFVEKGLRFPSDLAGAPEEDVAVAAGDTIGVKAFGRRVFRFFALGRSVQGQEAGGATSCVPGASSGVDPRLVELLGTEANASDIARALSGTGVKEVSIPEATKSIGCNDLPL